MKKLLLITLVFTVLFAACKKKDETDSSKINIRLENKSTYTFSNVVVKGEGQNDENNYGTLLPGRTTEYKVYTKMYRYAYIRLNIGEKEFILQPVDYVGETPLKSGKYTYSLTVYDFSQSRLLLDFKQD